MMFSMTRPDKNPAAMVRAFCKKHGICPDCRQRWTERDPTRCKRCNQAHAKYQKARARRDYQWDVKAGMCVRCHKRRAKPSNKRCQKCQDYHYDVKKLSKIGQ
jgi:hypothetical protein